MALAQADETMSDEDRWVEVDEVIVKHYNRGKVPASGYFTYGSPGVKVAVKGRLEEILKREQITQEDKLFPNGFGNTETYAD